MSPRKKKENKEEKVKMTNETVEKEPILDEKIVVEANQTEGEADDKASGAVLETLQKQYDELNDKFLRLNAEFQNYRKRVEKEKSDIFKFGNEKLLAEMLPIMDNFERALSAVTDEHPEDKVLNGVKLIKKTLDEFFDKNGVKKIEALHEPFDPDRHHAVMSEDSEDFETETVIEVFQEGYILNEKVIRPSMVKVTK